MKTWIISISAIVFITSIFGIIVPDSKIGKLIKSVFSILIIFVIISPIANIKNQDVSFENFINTSEIVYQNDYLDFIANKKAKELENESKKIIENLGVNNVFVNICYMHNNLEKFIVKSVEVNLKNAVIISDKAHINIKEQIRTELSSYLEIDKNLVLVNE